MAMKYAKDQPAGFVNQITNVAVVGAAGHVGKCITEELLKTGKHTVTAVTRADSQSTFAPGVRPVQVNYADQNSLVEAMRGQDALVITMNVLAPLETITNLVNAAIEAGVPWILPNEWGSDYTDMEINNDLGMGFDKLEIRRLIETKGSPTTSWIAVACGFWYDFSMAGETWTYQFDFAKKEVTFFNDGEFKQRQSTLPYCGQATARLLSLPIIPHDAHDKRPSLADYRNEICRVHAFHISQKDMLASVLRVTRDKESDWTVKRTSPESRFEDGKKMLQAGIRMGLRLMLYARSFYPSVRGKSEDEYSDKRLGLEAPSLDDATRWAVEQVKLKVSDEALQKEGRSY